MIEKYNHKGHTNLGFYGTLTNNVAIVPPKFKRKELLEVETIIETHIARTELVGLFTTGNKNGILIPNNTTELEKETLDEHNVNYTIIETTDTALGNLILANDKGAVISETIKEHKKAIEETLNVPVKIGTIGNITNPGVCGAANNYGAVLHRATTEKEAEKVKKTLELEKVDVGTINMGSPFIGSGLINNDRIILVGEDTTGPEIGRIDTTMVEKEE